MPNWVFNTINDYPKELYDKYSNTEKELDIDFNKIIPEPPEITNTVSGAYNLVAKNICKYRDFVKDLPDDKVHKYDYKNPLQKPIKELADRTTHAIGELAIENPDISLNEILASGEHNYEKNRYEEYVKVFGNKSFNNAMEYED